MKLLYSIEEVFSSNGYLKEKGKEFYNIPLYQRGYKWTEKEVKKLLDDITAFKPKGEKFYCLQNITLVPHKNNFNVVDGQQRLATLTLLLAYLEDSELVKNKLKFPNNSIREETNDFINKVVIENEDVLVEEDWESFIKSRLNYDHQDIYHLFHAYQEIDDWFYDNEDITKEDFRSKLLKNVKLIINLIDTKNDEEEIFGNLNSKRIPLDGADLFRAILITRVAREEIKKEVSIKEVIELNEKRVKLGWEFDQINNWWSQSSVYEYFKQFVSIKSDIKSSELRLFDTEKHPINQLLYLFAESEGRKELTLELVEEYNNNSLELYGKILKLHNTMVDWYEDREIYHFLGFLFANTKTTFSSIWKKWNRTDSRLSFVDSLKKDIKKLIYNGQTEIDFTNMDINWYENDKQRLIQILIVLDVINSLDNTQPFMHPQYFTKSLNDIEHIFPQTPGEEEDKKGYIEFLNERISEDKFDLSKYEKKKDDERYIQKMDEFIKIHVDSIHINSIGNLVLLYYKLNRSIGRISYAKKRARVIDEFNSGKYIQPHTFRVFVRYFNDANNRNLELEHWTNADIEANAKAINVKIKNFFN